jgi:hypothetical protein
VFSRANVIEKLTCHRQALAFRLQEVRKTDMTDMTGRSRDFNSRREGVLNERWYFGWSSCKESGSPLQMVAVVFIHRGSFVGEPESLCS